MSKKKFLITTANESTWKFDRPIVFLGEWCRLFNRKHIWNNISSNTISWHWSDRTKIKKDYNYLNSLYEKVLANLAWKLNCIHKVNHSERYWRIILGPWLLTYIAVLWDRWESVRIFGNLDVDCETIIPDLNFNTLVPENYSYANNLMAGSDIWNYFVYADVLKLQNHNNIKLIKDDISFDKEFEITNKKKKKSLKFHIMRELDKMLNKLTKTSTHNFIFYKSYFPKKFLLKLFYKMGQIPSFYSEFDTEINYETDVSFVRPHFKKEQGENNFEQFLYNRVFKDMPKVYLEGHKNISAYCNSLSNVKVIFTANAHVANEVFKVWTAKQVNKGAQLILSEHGGGLVSAMRSFNHEEKICDKKITWYTETNSKHVKLSPNILLNKRIKRKYNNQILFVGFDSTRYSLRVKSGSNSSLVLGDFKQKVNFINLLNKKTLGVFKIRSYDMTGNRGLLIKNRYAELYGKKIISLKKKIVQDFEISKLIICTYPQTTFLEAMHSGIPTVLLYKEENWDIHQAFDKLIAELKKAKIVHSDPVKAAKHINYISNNPDIWWNLPETIKARSMFLNMCGTIADDPLSEWVNFFKTIKLKQ
jgi:putative transferase (TIGR04331 family)